MHARWITLLLLFPLLTACASLTKDVASTMSQLDADGASYGLLVTDLSGKEIVAINPDKRFLPASNMKLITTAAAFAHMEVHAPDAAAGAAVYMLPNQDAPPNILLVGHGDARMSGAPDCESNCLSQLSQAIVEAAPDGVGEIMVHDHFSRDEPWAHGWSWEDLALGYGAAASGLNIDDNIIILTISPGETAGAPATLCFGENCDYYPLRNDVVTAAAGEDSDIHIVREAGSRWIRIYGAIAADAPPRTRSIGVEDPAHFVGWRLMKQLEQSQLDVGRGMSVWRGPPPLADDATPLAQLTPPPLIEDLAIINKDSNNLHAEVLLRRLGLIEGDGAIEDGLEVLNTLMETAGAPRAGYDLFDGSGMSIYNKLSPRAVTALLLWAHGQEWGEDYTSTLAVAGVDGSLKRRFLDSPLTGELFAKTGTLNGANSLSGYMTAASGETLVFSMFVNNRASVSGSALDEMQDVLEAIAAAN